MIIHNCISLPKIKGCLGCNTPSNFFIIEIEKDYYRNKFIDFLTDNEDKLIFGYSTEMQTSKIVKENFESINKIFLALYSNKQEYGYAELLVGEKSIEISGWVIKKFRNSSAAVIFYVLLIRYCIANGNNKPIVTKVYEKNAISIKLHLKLSFEIIGNKLIHNIPFFLFNLNFKKFNENIFNKRF